MADPVTVETAHGLEQEIVRRVAQARESWVPLAYALFLAHKHRAWEQLGCESLNEWIACPEISLGRAQVFAMIGAWRDLVDERHIAPERLTVLDVSKVAVVLPAVRRGVDVDEALADCELLSRSDLRDKYQHHAEASYRTCETCGQRVREAV